MCHVFVLESSHFLVTPILFSKYDHFFLREHHLLSTNTPVKSASFSLSLPSLSLSLTSHPSGGPPLTPPTFFLPFPSLFLPFPSLSSVQRSTPHPSYIGITLPGEISQEFGPDQIQIPSGFVNMCDSKISFSDLQKKKKSTQINPTKPMQVMGLQFSTGFMVLKIFFLFFFGLECTRV